MIRLDARLIRLRLAHERPCVFSLCHLSLPIGGCSVAAFTSLQGALERRRGFFHPSSLIRKSKPAAMTAGGRKDGGTRAKEGELRRGELEANRCITGRERERERGS